MVRIKNIKTGFTLLEEETGAAQLFAVSKRLALLVQEWIEHFLEGPISARSGDIVIAFRKYKRHAEVRITNHRHSVIILAQGQTFVSAQPLHQVANLQHETYVIPCLSNGCPDGLEKARHDFTADRAVFAHLPEIVGPAPP